MDTIVRVGGAAGDGVASFGQMMARSFSRLGYHVNAYNSYQSVIRGGHVWYNVRATRGPVHSIGDRVDVLIAIDRLTAEVHAPLLKTGGVIIHDAEKVKLDDLDLPKGVVDLGIPARQIAKDLNNPLSANVVALGAVAHVVGLDPEGVKGVIKSQFEKKGDEVIRSNITALEKGAAAAASVDRIRTHPRVGDPMPLITGNEALALGAVGAGLGYYAAYPMTPASSILHYLAKAGPGLGVVVKQMEDEIGVVNSTIGAAFAGARSMCGTSGGGFALMTEAIGLAGMAEIGIVVVNSMRGGPSTGLPTKTEQADLFQMLGAGQGDYPRAIIAPADPADAYKAAVEAHEIADKYQMPVILAMDFYLSETTQTINEDDLPAVRAIERSIVDAGGDGFKRYKDTPSGISPRSVPGIKGLEFVAASDEHDESAGLVSDVRAGLPESLTIRNQQVAKRMRKVDTLLETLPAPTLEGDTRSGPVVVCWGSTAPALREARELLDARGVKTQQLTLRYIVPFHAEAVEHLLQGRKFIVAEGSFSGQLQRYIRMETSLVANGHVRRYDGEPFTPEYLANGIEEVVRSW